MVRQFRPKSHSKFFFLMEPLPSIWFLVLSLSFQHRPPHGTTLVRTYPFLSQKGWLENDNFGVTSDDPNRPMSRYWVIIS